MISLIMTVFNEGDNIRAVLESLLTQTRVADEIVIVDGGSRDNTVAVMREYENRLPLRILVEPGSNISVGRNRAIAAACGEIIAITDAGVVLAKDWLERITQPLLDDPALEVVSGYFRTDPQNLFEVALGAATIPFEEEVHPDKFLPSSRSVAVRKIAWVAVGGYPEWLDYGEDVVFDQRLRAISAPTVFEPRALVYFRPRRSLRAFYKQYYLYARGDGKADLWRKRHVAAYVAYLILTPLILWLAWRKHWLFLALLLPGALIRWRGPYQRLPHVLDEARRQGKVRVTLSSNLLALAYIPVIRVVGDVAKMIGYPVGWWWRIKNRPPSSHYE